MPSNGTRRDYRNPGVFRLTPKTEQFNLNKTRKKSILVTVKMFEWKENLQSDSIGNFPFGTESNYNWTINLNDFLVLYSGMFAIQ